MKVIKYKALGKTVVAVTREDGSTENVEQDMIYTVIRPYSEEMEALAEVEAYEGKYTRDDDGEPETPPTDAERIAELEQALAMLLSGVTE